jgi:hypothetical protein
MNTINLRKEAIHQSRRRSKLRKLNKRGLGYVWVAEVPLPSYEQPRILSRIALDDSNDYGGSYTIVTRVKVPASIVSMKDGWKMMKARVGCYLNWHDIISTKTCHHSYDCCGGYYPSGHGKVLSVKGRTIVVSQDFHQNV